MIKSISLKNFRSFSDESIEFIEGKNLIFGPGHSGKSSILHALFYGLTGSTLDGLDPKDYVREGEREADIEIIFLDKDDNEYLVRRKIASNKRTKEDAHLYQNNKEITSVKKEVDSKIMDILGFNEDYFMRAIFMKEGDVYEYLTSKKKSQALAEIDKLVKAQRVDEISRDLKKLSKQYDTQRKELAKKIEKEKIRPEFDEEEAENKIKELESRLKDIEEEKEELEEIRNKLRTLENLKIKKEDLEERRGEVASKLASYRKEYGDDPEAIIDSELKEKTSEKNRLEEEIKEITAEIGKIQGTIEKEEEELERIREVDKTGLRHCPTCEQVLTPDLVKTVINKKEERILELENERFEAKTKLEEKENLLIETNRRIKKLEDDLRALGSIKESLNQINREIDENKKEIEKIDVDVTLNLKEIEDKISDLDSEYNVKLREKIKLETQLGIEWLDISELEEDLKKVKYLGFICEKFVEACKETVQELRKDIFEKMSKEAEEVWSNFMEGTWSIEYDGLDPEFIHGAEKFHVRQLSGSEKIISFMATRVALAKAVGNPNFFVIDEPVEHLDSKDAELMMRLIQKLDIKQVIVTTNNELLGKDENWDLVYNIKKNDYSTIEK
ncbi:MAG: AAA family ATPase [Candidatus Hydrothermarchaeota archaeon]